MSAQATSMSGSSTADCSGTTTPMTNSSCELVIIGEDEIQDAKQNTEMAGESTQGGDVNGVEDADNVENIAPELPNMAASEDAVKDEELRHLMDILQERVRSGSPSHSLSSTDSDFIQLAGGDREPEEMMDLSSDGSATARFNIIVNRNVNNFGISDGEEEDVDGVFGEDSPPDADDRVESDIVVPQPEGLPAPVEEPSRALPIRHYIHSPNRHLNTVLTAISLIALSFAVGIALGHWIGSAREAYLQQEIQEGQKLRLRSVQDDLLMCLRKQEDIDQTINKLNEIENILVDAEHWRNEYEELLNIKLQNEEKWRLERADLKTSLASAERSYDQLVKSKSCAHDNDFLSRQESTLKSVHEKLEASLSDKDLVIEKLQAEVLDMKVELLTADQMASSYRKSNEDKSLLILGLKEQVLVLEREMFDLKTSSEVQTVQEGSEAVEASAERGQGLSTQENQEQATDNVQVEKKVDSNVAVSSTPEVKVTEDPAPAALSASEDVTSEDKQTIAQLQEKVTVLQMQIKSYESEHTDRESTNHTNSSSPCIVFNICDYLKVNMSKDQLLSAYHATQGQYSSLQSFLASEWQKFVLNNKSDQSEASEKQSAPRWKLYMNQTKSVVSEFLDTMNSTWQEISAMSQGIVGDKLSKKTSQINSKLANAADMISHGVGTVKDRLSRVFDRGSSTSEPESSTQDEETSQADTKPKHNQKMVKPKHARKFRERLNKLREMLADLDLARVDQMKKAKKKGIYERLDDFVDDYSRMFTALDMPNIKLWAECQTSWWKAEAYGGKTDVDFIKRCTSSLMPWQRSLGVLGQEVGDDKAEENWLFERAESREYHRDEPDDWFWRRAHDYEQLPGNVPSRDEL